MIDLMAMLATAALMAAPVQHGTLDRVSDGDTVRVLINGHSTAVRLIGVDTPETHRPATPVECGGPQATNLMRSIVHPGDRVALRIDPTQDTVDRYGRLLRYAYANHRDLGRAEISAGWGRVYVYRKPFQRFGRYAASQQVAQRERRGVWRACNGDFHSAS